MLKISKTPSSLIVNHPPIHNDSGLKAGSAHRTFALELLNVGFIAFLRQNTMAARNTQITHISVHADDAHLAHAPASVLCRITSTLELDLFLTMLVGDEILRIRKVGSSASIEGFAIHFRVEC